MRESSSSTVTLKLRVILKFVPSTSNVYISVLYSYLYQIGHAGADRSHLFQIIFRFDNKTITFRDKRENIEWCFFLADHVLFYVFLSHCKGGRIFSPWPHKTGLVGRNKIKKIKKCILMYNQANMHLHVDLFIKYISNNGQFYIDITNNWQRKLLIKLKSLYFF